ncbi:hypothetical protein SPBR_03596 [Sporothrix brasiliensis 5110]|uniref:Zinc finger PHD-type domain-containing protein n=1 Tax=Sporothrix brasiliensis 5110 TaxID=1398154 RepID=A0A0C2JDF5_9PEZI|nr:uncharacterized protein SPBR_03596 [Sporothrix brasiliensis 5110]KIH94982.1 hypothetical protein SPBR_03596 [Sporothrix brasiliensis 5110]
MPQEPGRRRLPFLHRNWTAGVTACQEWTSKRKRQSPPTGSAHISAVPTANGVDEESYMRPLKRRRVAQPLQGAPSSIEDLVKLPQCPSDRSNGLRIQAFNIFHQDTPRLRFANGFSAKETSEVTRHNVRFKVTILSEKYGRTQLMYCTAQIGAVHAIRASSGPYGLAKLVLEPFTVPLENIAVLHHHGDKLGLADKYMLRVEIESTASNEPWPPLDLLSLADASLHGSDYRPKKACDCVLYAESSDFFGRPRMRIPLWLRESVQHDAVRTEFVMDMDVRWTTGFLERPRRHLNLGVLPTIVALHPDEPLPPPTLDLCDLWPRRQSYRAQFAASTLGKKTASAASDETANARANGHMNGTANVPVGDLVNGTANGTTNRGTNEAPNVTNGIAATTDLSGQLQTQINLQLNRELNGQINARSSGATVTAGPTTVISAEAADDNNDDLEWPSTPSRSLRARRDQPEYNVRNITNKAHKIGDRGPRKRGSDLFANVNGFTNGNSNGSSCHVKVTYYYQQDYASVDGFQCCMCMAMNLDLDHLRLHFRSHSQYIFQYEHRPGARSGDHFFKIVHDLDSSNVRLQDIVYQLGRPTGALDIEKFLQGDESWVTARCGPLNDDQVVKNAQAPRRVPTPTPVPPNLKKKILVPSTRQPLYDPLSKALLKPGTTLRTNIVDDSWRIHKHREIVQDYTDLTPAEKDFIQEWDRFIILKRIASDAYIPRAMVQFIQEKGLWLVSDLDRAMEFGKLMAVMMAHDILTDSDVDNITQAIDEAWSLKKSVAAGDDQALTAAQSTSVPKVYAPRRGTGGCPLCGFRCAVADSVICSNKCSRRQYHTACLGQTAIVDVAERGEWYCNDCAHLADPSHLVRPLEQSGARPVATEVSSRP